jgi:hypothetical protein
MSSKGFKALSRLDIPQLYCLIGTAADEGFSAITQGNRPDCLIVPNEGFEALSGFGIPQLNGLVATATD